MKPRIARFLSPILAVYLLLVTVGVPLEQVYCACVGQVQLSIAGLSAVVADPCVHGADDPAPLFACCAQRMAARTGAADEAPGACHFGDATRLDNAHPTAGNCMTTEVVYAHFDADFVVMDMTDDADGDLPIVIPSGITPAFSLPALAALAQAHPVRPPSSSPSPPSGWELRVLHQSFLC